MNRSDTLGSALWRVSVEIIIVMPVLYLLGSLVYDEQPMTWIYIGEVFAFAYIGVFIRSIFKYHVAVQFVLGLPICLALALFIGFKLGDNTASRVIPFITAPLIFYRGKLHSQSDWESLMPPFIPLFLLILTLICFGMTNLIGVYKPYASTLSIITPISIIAVLYAMNTIHLRDLTEGARVRNSASKLAVSKGLGKQDSLLLLGVGIIAVLLSFGTWLVTAANWFVNAIWSGLSWIANKLFYFQIGGSGQEVAADESDAGLLNVDYVKNPFWDDFFEVVSYVILVIVTIALICIIIWALWKAYKALTRLMGRLSLDEGFNSGGDAGFEDEREKIIDLKQLPKMYRDEAAERLRNMMRREPKWEDQKTIEDKVRFMYCRSLKKAMQAGYHHNKAFTPLQALKDAQPHMPAIAPIADELADNYDLVKYSPHTPEENNVDELHDKMKY